MNIVWAMLHPGKVRNFESTLRLLAERGHRVHVEFGGPEKLSEGPMLERISADHPAITFAYAPSYRDREWTLVARTLRLYVDYLRYLHPRYAGAAKLRARIADRVPASLRRLAAVPGVRSDVGLAACTRVLVGIEPVIPPPAEIDALLTRVRPDVLLVTPLVDVGSEQVDYVKAARALGIPVGLCVASWDNLTNKGLMRVLPDLVTVWNEAQKREAVELHAVPPERVAVTGAPAYDHWFEWKPSAAPDAFRARVGLPPGRPFVLYLGSSPFIAPDETRFARQWVRAIRGAADPAVAEAGLLIRPHPQNARQWRDVEFGPDDHVAIWPRAGANPIDETSKSDYFDSMYHCSAVVGVNTSGQIESAILGRPVFTVLDPEFAGTQEGTLHFHHLLAVSGGLLHVARNLAEHVGQLGGVLARGGMPEDDRSRDFVAAFVRPHGRHVAATPLLVEAIEDLGRRPAPAPVPVPLWVRAARPLLNPVARGFRRAWRARNRRRKAALRRQAGEPGAKDAGPAPPARQRRAGDGRAAWTAAAFGRELDALTAGRANRSYRSVREHVLRMKEQAEAGDTGQRASAYWQEELAGFDYMLDASPLVVAKLRQHTHHITGIRPYEYRSHRNQGPFEDKLAALLAIGGKDLLVPEPPLLGGFGFEVGGALYNLDTLKFYEALIALDRGGLLADFRAGRERRVVWEIGAGWGGFAYQFKTLFPNVTYVISDLPELFLFSAVYLMEAFPDARIAFHPGPGAELAGWEDLDFVFVPSAAPEAVRPARLHLTVNMVSFQEMTEGQVRGYAAAAHALSCPYVYSLNRDRSPYNPELGSVRAVLAEHYWLHEIPVLDVSYPKMLDRAPRSRWPRRESSPADLDYHHVVGWRRTTV